MNGEDYCELCDLRLSQCPHGMPAPTPVVAPTPAPRVRKAAAPRVTKPTGPPVTSSTSSTTRRRTSSEQLEVVVYDILTAAGGSLAHEAVLAEIEERMEDRFRPGDHERTPTGELRWQLAARKARQSLITQGLMSKDQPGVWSLA